MFNTLFEMRMSAPATGNLDSLPRVSRKSQPRVEEVSGPLGYRIPGSRRT